MSALDRVRAARAYLWHDDRPSEDVDKAQAELAQAEADLAREEKEQITPEEAHGLLANLTTATSKESRLGLVGFRKLVALSDRYKP